MPRLAPIALLALLAQPAHAAGDGLFYPALNFVTLVVALFFLTRKPIRAYFDTRRDGIKSEIETAARLKREAEQRYSTWQGRISELEGELAGIRETARERAEVERQKLLAEARASAERIRQDAASAVDQELRRARTQLRDEASALAVELAAGVLQREVTDGDRQQLLDEFIQRIERAPEVQS